MLEALAGRTGRPGMNFRASGFGVGSVWMKRVRDWKDDSGVNCLIFGIEGRFWVVMRWDSGVVMRVRLGEWRIMVDAVVRDTCERRREVVRDLAAEAIVSFLI